MDKLYFKWVSVVAALLLSLSVVAEPLSSSALAEVAGPTRVLYTHPQSLNQHVATKLWAGSEHGGLWRSDDGGSSWVLASTLMRGLSVTAIVADPVNLETIYVGAGIADNADVPAERGIFKSEDGGKNWTLLALTNAAVVGESWNRIHHIAVSRAGVLLVATSDKKHNGFIYRSTDGGEHWGLFPVYSGNSVGPRNTIHRIKFDPENPNAAIFMDNFANVTHSADGGLTWQLVRKSTTCK